MSKTKSTKNKAVEQKVIASHAFEDHLAIIQHASETWEARARAMDAIDSLSKGKDEKSNKEAKIAKADIAFSILMDVQFLEGMLLFLYANEVSDATLSA